MKSFVRTSRSTVIVWGSLAAPEPTTIIDAVYLPCARPAVVNEIVCVFFSEGSIDDPVALGEFVPVIGSGVSGGGGGCALNAATGDDLTLPFLILISLGYWLLRCRPHATSRGTGKSLVKSR